MSSKFDKDRDKRLRMVSGALDDYSRSLRGKPARPPLWAALLGLGLVVFVLLLKLAALIAIVWGLYELAQYLDSLT